MKVLAPLHFFAARGFKDHLSASGSAARALNEHIGRRSLSSTAFCEVAIHPPRALSLRRSLHLNGCVANWKIGASKNLGWYRSHGCCHPEETFHEADLVNNRSFGNHLT
jgi:hypothetical protein